MAKYIDGFLLIVPKKNLSAYKTMALEASKVWKKYGALDYKECTGDDLNPKWAKLTFPKIMKPKSNEVIVFSYIVFKSKADRTKVNAKVMKDPFMKKYENKPMPFDMKKMAYGGFNVLVEA